MGPVADGEVGERLSWNQPRCESCWFEVEGDWDGDHLLAVRRPVRRPGPTVIEQCAWCGRPTFIGIFVRADPASVPFPRLQREEAGS
jgi:hypothetical protein